MAVYYREEAPRADEYWHLFQTTGWNQKYRATADDLGTAVANSWVVVCAYEDDSLVGCGRVVSDGVLHAMIFDLIVHPAHQRQGIGSRILQMLVDECLRAGITDIQLFSARGKQAFYERRGFVVRPADAPGMEYRRSHGGGERHSRFPG